MAQDALSPFEARLYAAGVAACRQAGAELKGSDYPAMVALVVWQGYADAYEAGECPAAQLSAARAKIAAYTTDEIRNSAKLLWAVAPALKSEFPSPEIYAAYVVGTISGRIRRVVGHWKYDSLRGLN